MNAEDALPAPEEPINEQTVQEDLEDLERRRPFYSAEEILDMLKDPTTVAVNILRGTIAKPTQEQLEWI